MEQRHGKREVAAREAIRQCFAEGVLTEFLQSRRGKVVDSMTPLFSREEVWEMEKHEFIQKAKGEGVKEGEIIAYADLVNDGTLTLSNAQARLKLSAQEFCTKAAEFGHPIVRKAE